jgi:hypothetical protein
MTSDRGDGKTGSTPGKSAEKGGDGQTTPPIKQTKLSRRKRLFKKIRGVGKMVAVVNRFKKVQQTHAQKRFDNTVANECIKISQKEFGSYIEDYYKGRLFAGAPKLLLGYFDALVRDRVVEAFLGVGLLDLFEAVHDGDHFADAADFLEEALSA